MGFWGVLGYLLKKETVAELAQAIRAAVVGSSFVSSSLNGGELRSLLRPGLRACEPTMELTGRQKQVLSLIANGLGHKEIAAQLGISIKTVEFHKYGMMERLGVSTQAELVIDAIRLGVVSS